MPSLRHELAARLLKAQPGLDRVPLEAARLIFKDASRLFVDPDGLEVTPLRVGERPAELLRVGAADRGGILYLHGGGYCLGSLDSHRALAARVGAAAGCEVLLTDYRLAPEHPFPAALEDATNAWRWWVARAGGADRLLVAGDSAGGGLALALLMKLRDAGEPLPRGAVCLSPWTDLELSRMSTAQLEVDDPLITPSDARRLAALYAGGRDTSDPAISPLFGDPTGLPPLLVQVGTRDLLFEDARRFAERAEAAGVAVSLEVWPQMIHVWHVLAPLVPEASEAIEAVGSWIGSRLGRQMPVETV